MGVTGLWTVVQPCARPMKLETLNRKRLAVDASIWIYQFLKAVRDKEGNALRNAHVVGFFRRICKLLFIGIKPVFVFDGGAPILKRQTIASRKKRREGRREDAVQTASKLLALQMQRRAEEEETKRKTLARPQNQEEVLPDVPVYAEEVFMSEKERKLNRKFRKTDAYHLPELDVSLEQMGAPNDPRIMSQDELEEYARQFHSGEDINLYDFSKIDFDSPFFLSLPASDRYNILNAGRLRSRLRMGYSKEQLDTMFPDRMAFSKFQIERVKERNNLTQRLMNLNGMNGEDGLNVVNSGQRIAGERGKEYVLVKNSEVEGGWALGVVGNKSAGAQDKPIDVDNYDQQETILENDGDSQDDDFEDVPIEGLNRLPKLSFLEKGAVNESIRRQRIVATERHNLFGRARRLADQAVTTEADELEENSLFVHSIGHSDRTRDLFEENDMSEEDDLRRAIELSLEDEKDVDFEDVLSERDLSTRSIREIGLEAFPESDDDDMDFSTALSRSKRAPAAPKPQSMAPSIAEHAMSGPLPFESLLVKRPTRPKEDDHAGGFERPLDRKQEEKEKILPLPPWFHTDDKKEKQTFITDGADDVTLAQSRKVGIDDNHIFLQNQKPTEVIDVDRLSKPKEVVILEDSDPVLPAPFELGRTSALAKMEDVTDFIHANHPILNTQPVVESPGSEIQPAESFIQSHLIQDSASVELNDSERVPKDAWIVSGFSQGRSSSPEFENVSQSLADMVNGPPANIASDVLVRSAGTLEVAEREETAFVAGNEDEFSDPEDETLFRQLAEEAEEHARFASTLNKKTPAENAFDYDRELKQLRSQQKKDRRDADEVSQVMITECQQLLRLFGLPYITAPMEAEAQCAELVSLGLVDGIVTDDSDCFLFGGTRIYKNMFNQSKFVECYLLSDLEKEYALDRRKLIQFAHLLGSDYTEGIPGVGPVTAMEIITEFNGLEEFRDWWTKVQTGAAIPEDTHSAFRKKFKKNAAKLFLPPSFPDPHINTAYLEPEVDCDPSQFQWGVPDLDGLRNFLMATIGWTQERTDEVLVPVIRDMNRREQEGTQSNITHFMSGSVGAGAFAPRVRADRKGRMEKALSRLREEAETRKRTSGGPTIDVNTKESNEVIETSRQSTKKRKKQVA